jgi:ATP-dependent DNA helicase DinG
MLLKDTKDEIQKAYSQFLSAKGLKSRYGQKLMIAEIARTLGSVTLDEDGMRTSDGHICVIEAGTGTGKTVAYLLATLAIAKALNKSVVLATATIALQEQVVLKDLPELIRHSGLKFQYRLAKGRGRYLCLAKLDRILSTKDESQLIPLYEDEFSVINEQDVALYTTMMEKLATGKWDGDRDSWQDEIQPAPWQRVTTDHRQCTGRQCSHVRSCAFFKARDELNEAEIIVANHDLVLADLALGGGAILPAPENAIYIFDEGHHLPDKALNHFAHQLRYKSTVRWLGQSEGQWPGLQATVIDARYFSQLAEPLEVTLKNTRTILESHLPILQEITASVDRTKMSPLLRFANGVAPESIEVLARQLCGAFAELVSILAKLYKELTTLMEEDYGSVPKVDLENLYPILGTWLARAEAGLALWGSYRDTKMDEAWPHARWISVIEFGESVDYELVASPILASRALQKDLWSRCCGAVVTSATLTALNSFDRFKYRAGTYDDSHYATVPSPFNFSENAKLCIPKEAVEANNALLHTESIIDLLPNILDEKAGSLVLFSSRRQMAEVYEDLPSKIKKLILMQGNESKQELIRKHKKTIDENLGSIIFGLASFAEGVDLPGKYCTHVVIAKIPFSVPDDPLEAALAEWIEARGGNSFMEVSVPDACVRLIQACGRLLRNETDIGRVSILDKRLLTKRYGRSILDALPPFARDF